MKTPYSRTPRNYNGTKPTTRKMNDVLPGVLAKIYRHQENRSGLILAAWPHLVGDKIATMSKALSFDEGVLQVSVANSSLLSLLQQVEKRKLLIRLKQKFPKADIKDIRFRMG